MRVAVYYNNSDVRVEERPRPRISAGELLMRVHASGICGSDVMEWYRMPRAPIVLGHEVAGTVEEVGAGVPRLRPGDRIVATHHVPCDECRYCRTDRHSVCRTLKKTSFDPGGFSELLRLTPIHVERGVFPLPDSVGFDAATFVEPLACALRGQRLVGLRPGDSVAVLGSGISGLLHLQLARAHGAGPLFATDVQAFRREAAGRLGADAVFAPDGAIEAIRRANGGRLVDRVLVCTAARQAILQGLSLADDGGTVLLYAPPAPGETMEFPVHDLWMRGVSIVHTYAGPPAEMRKALDLLAAGAVDVDTLITHRLGLDGTARGFALTAAATDSLKIIINPTRYSVRDMPPKKKT